MAFSFGQGLLDLAKNNGHRPTFSFEDSQAVPKADDFSLSRRVHAIHSRGISHRERKENKLQDANSWDC
jgi:hypothetical protein